MRKVLTFAVAAAFLLGGAISASAVPITIYANNFDGPATVGAGVTAVLSTPPAAAVESVQGLPTSGVPFAGNFLRNDDSNSLVTLSLSGLGAHSSVSLGFLLGILDSWDGFNCCGPDVMSVEVDNTLVFSEVFATAGGGGQTWSPDGFGSYGFNGSWSDQAINLSSYSPFQNIAHTASTLTIEFYVAGGWQAGDDESWGIDNLNISMEAIETEPAPVPEPGTLLLLGLPLAGLAVRRLRRL